MKNILNKVSLMTVVIMALYSCNPVEEVNLARGSKPEANLVESSVSVTEGQMVTVNITADKPTTRDMIFKLVQVGGDAVDGVDYTFAENSAPDYGPIGGKIVIPAYATSGSTTITGLTDFAIDNKSAQFELRSMQSMRGVVGGGKMLSLSIDDYTEDDLSIVLSWEVNSSDEVACDQDLDLYIVDATDTELAHSWFDCPESVTLPAAAPDGDYFIDVDYWAPNTVAADPATDPIYNTKYTLTVGQVGVSSEQFGNDFSDADTSNYYLNWSGYYQYGGDGYHQHVLQITKAGTSYTTTQL